MKKLLAYSLAVMAIVWSLGLAVNVPNASAAYAPTTGDLIKTATNSAVYYIGTDNKRHLYVNEVTFWTYYTGSWSSIKSGTATKTIRTISQADFETLTMGDHVRANSGALLQFDNSNRMYTVTTGSKLALVPDTATAQSIFGSNWNTKLIVIQSSFEIDYTKDGVLDETAGWQDFASLSMHFDLKYPNDWRRTVGNTPGTSYTYSLMLGPVAIAEDFLFGVVIVDKIPSLGVSASNPNQEITKVEDVSFKGIAAKKVFTKNLTANKEWSEIYVSYGGVILKIGQPTINNSDFPFDHSYNNIIEEILTSFNFLPL